MKSGLVALSFFAILLTLLIYPSNIEADNSSSCTNISIIFARGSGQNKNSEYLDSVSSSNFERVEPQTYKFFKEINARQSGSKEFVSLHNFEDKYSPFGYKAVGVEEGFSNKSTHRTDTPLLYYESVKDGVAELTGYLHEKISACPNQKIIVGGYSQGAQVVGETLWKLSVEEREHITYVALFGDPKYNAKSVGNPFKSGNWVRGNNLYLQSGILGPRNNYKPTGITKMGSWCDLTDPVCTGWFLKGTTPTRIIADKFTGTHSGIYQNKWIPQAANEIAGSIKSANQEDTSFTKGIWVNKESPTNKLDVMVVMDVSGSMNWQLREIQRQHKKFIESVYGKNWDTRAGLVIYSDDHKTPWDTPYFARTVTNLTNNRLQFYDGLQSLYAINDNPNDLPEAMYSGLMEAMKKQNWRVGAQKKIIVITDAKAHNPDTGPEKYTYAQVKKYALELDPVVISAVTVPNSPAKSAINNSSAKELADDTGGINATANFSDQTSIDSLVSIFTSLDNSLVAILEGDTNSFVDEPVYVSAGSSYDPDGSISSYEWDCNNDEVFESTTDSPSYSCLYASPYSGYIVVDVKSADGGSAKGILWVDVTNGQSESSIPASPQATTQRIDSSSAKITITTSYPVGTFFVQYDSEGNFIGAYDSSEIALQDIPASNFDVFISAVNENGESEKKIITVPEYVAPTTEPDPINIDQPIIEPIDKVLPETEPNTTGSDDKLAVDPSPEESNPTTPTTTRRTPSIAPPTNNNTQQEQNTDVTQVLGEQEVNKPKTTDSAVPQPVVAVTDKSAGNPALYIGAALFALGVLVLIYKLRK
jgi:Cutinase/von Willebrand factor type A domain